MIYLFAGNSNKLIKNEVKKWKNSFLEKFGEFNLTHIKDISQLDDNFISEVFLSTSFLSEKKLVVIDDLPSNSSDDSNNKIKEDFILYIIDKVPENNIILFNSFNCDKRGKLYKKIKEIGEIRDFEIKDEFSIKKLIKKNYIITDLAINKIIKFKGLNYDKISCELDKLSIIFDEINEFNIDENILPELEESIFLLIDDLLNNNALNGIKKMGIIIEQANIYAFYNNLLSNLRTQVYIELLKNIGVKNISEVLNLGNRAFLVNKNYKINFSKLYDLYIELVNLDKKMKTGDMIGSEESDFKFEIEKVFLYKIS